MIPRTFVLRQIPPTNNNVKIKLNLAYYFVIFVLFLSLFVSATAFAVVIPTKIPLAATNDPLFAKGYLNVMHYGVIAGNNSGAIPADNVALINQAIKHAYNRENDTEFEDTALKSFTRKPVLVFSKWGILGQRYDKGAYGYWAKKTDGERPAINFDVPRNHLTIVGDITKSATGNYNIYPVIKLVGSNRAPSFTDSTQPKHLVEFLNWFVTDDGPIATCAVADGERGNEGYNQMVKGLELDCNGNAGCVGLFFNQAQNSSIENVRIKPGHTVLKEA